MNLIHFPSNWKINCETVRAWNKYFFFVEKSLGYNAPCTLSYEIESILQLESNLVVQSSLSWFVTLALNLTEIWIWVPKVKNKRPLFLMYWAMVWGRSYMTLDSYFYLLSRICDGFKVAKYHSSFFNVFLFVTKTPVEQFWRELPKAQEFRTRTTLGVMLFVLLVATKLFSRFVFKITSYEQNTTSSLFQNFNCSMVRKINFLVKIFLY